jgi:predicted nucleotidyltransferase
MKYTTDEKKLKKRLAELGFSNLSEFAAKAGIHRNTLSNLLSGRSIFSASFQSLAQALQMDPMDLATPRSDFTAKAKHGDEIRPLVARLAKESPGAAVLLLGSRASGKAKNYSDWDLGIFGYPAPLSGLEYLRLKGIVEEMSEDLVRQVDLVHLNQAPLWFLEDLSSGPIIFLDGNKEAWVYFQGVMHGIKKEKAA